MRAGGVNPIGLGDGSHRERERPSPLRVDPRDRVARPQECRSHAAFVAAGGLQQEVVDPLPSQRLDQLSVAFGRIGERQVLLTRPRAHCQAVLGNVDTDTSVHGSPYTGRQERAASSSPRLLKYELGLVQLFGLADEVDVRPPWLPHVLEHCG